MEPVCEFTVGIDLAQDSFDAAIANVEAGLGNWRKMVTAHFEAAPGSQEAIAALVAWIGSRGAGGRCIGIVVESTGKISQRFASALRGHGGWPEVAIINPRRSKAFGESLGVRDKTDRVDAQVLALFAAAHRPEPAKPKGQAEERLREKSRLREAYVDDLNKWENQRREAVDDDAREIIDQTIRHIKDAIDRLECSAEEQVKADVVLETQVKALKKIKGIKRVCAMTLTAELGDLSAYGREQLTAAAGLFPKVFESGTSVHRRPRLAKGGGSRVRRVLYLAATSLFQSKGPLRELIERLKAKGVAKMSICGIMMRKLLLIARAVVKNGGVFDENRICCEAA